MIVRSLLVHTYSPWKNGAMGELNDWHTQSNPFSR